MKPNVSGTILLVSILLTPLGAEAQTVMAQEAPRVSTAFLFISPVFSGFDSYYDQFVFAYKMGSKGKIAVYVLNSASGPTAEISGVGIWLDWMSYSGTIRSTECTPTTPCVQKPGILSSYKFAFDVPSIPPDLNEVPHLYEVRVFALVDGKDTLVSRSLDFGLATYSSDQADAQQLIAALRFFFASFKSAEANSLFTKALLDLELGRTLYSGGQFSLAKSQLEMALSELKKAVETEASAGKALDEGVIIQARAAQLEAEAAKSQADASKIQADSSKKMAEAAVIQADVAKLQVEAQRAVASSLQAQADAFRLQAESSRLQAFGVSLGTIIIGVALLIFAVKRPRA